MIEAFLEYLEVEKKYSPNTITSYKKDIDDFSEFLTRTEAGVQMIKVENRMIKNFIYYLSEQNFSKRSINRKLSTLRSFFNFLLKIGEITISPVETINSLKFYAEKQIPMSVEEMNDLSEIVYEDEPLLKILIVETLYQTGMRKAELCNLLVQNIDLEAHEMKIVGKGNKERIIPISEDLAKKYKIYLTSRKAAAGHDIWFFISEKGKKLNEKFVYSVVNNYLGLITFKQKKSPHILRHSFATHVLSKGAEISKVKKILGHASLASTQVYTHADIDQLKKVFNDAHPRAKK